MKCFERLARAHINGIIPNTLEPVQFPYRPNRSTYDTIYIAIYTAVSHLDKRNTYVRMLFLDYSAVLNTIKPSKLNTKLRTLGLNTSLCNWILDFLMGSPQVVIVGNNTTATVTLQHGWLSGVRESSHPVHPVHPWPRTTPTPSISLLTTQQW